MSNNQAQVLRNLTSRRIRIGPKSRQDNSRPEKQLLLAPFQQREMDNFDSFDLEPWELFNVVSKLSLSKTQNDDSSGNPEEFFDKYIGPLFFPGVLLLSVLLGILKPFWDAGHTGAVLGASFFFLLLAFWLIIRLNRGSLYAGQTSSLFLVLLIGIGGPTLSLLFLKSVQNSYENQFAETVIKILFIAIVSTLPALLFFLFDRQQAQTLRDRFLRQLMRLEPDVRTITDVYAIYGRELDEVFGTEADAKDRLQRGVRTPIVIATLVITLGWIITLLPLDGKMHYLLLPLTMEGTATKTTTEETNTPLEPDARELMDRSTAQLIDKSPTREMIWPRQTATTFAFLGAYFFALSTILRRHVRGDLRPKAYSSITVRMILVTILAWVWSLTNTSNDAENGILLLVIAFSTGIFPETGLTLILEKARVQFAGEKHPLTKLEGIDLYDRSLLEDEGINNVQALAKHDFVNLILSTHIPVPRLVDWVDQAVLYLHLHQDIPGAEVSQKDHPAPLLDSLRSYGIRTATELQRALKDKTTRSTVLKIFDQRGDQLATVIEAMGNADWLRQIQCWHIRGTQEDVILEKPEDLYETVDLSSYNTSSEIRALRATVEGSDKTVIST